MKVFDAEIKRDEGGRLTVLELPFDAKKEFHYLKGTIFVTGTINGVQYRGKLLSRGGGKYCMVMDKALQKAVGFNGKSLPAHVAMTCEAITGLEGKQPAPAAADCTMDVLTAIKTRRSIRSFTCEPVSETLLNTILCAGLYAPTAKDKQPCHFVVLKDKKLLFELSCNNANAAMLQSAACGIVICGDKNIEGMTEFLYEDCAAAAQNMLLCIHGLGLGGVWCGIVAHSDWQKLITCKCELPAKLEPVVLLALGWPDEVKEQQNRWEPGRIHDGKW